MITLVIPDVHLKHKIIEKIIAEVPHDEVVILGDEYDNFGDSPEINAKVARWLLKSVNDPTRIHLLGNHDTHYFFNNPRLPCSGWTESKKLAIQNVLKDSNIINNLKWFYYSNGWLFTHAGLSNYFVKDKDPKQVLEYLEHHSKIATRLASCTDKNHFFYQAGYDRGGGYPVGGLTWCDYHSFVPIPGINQCFGHTPAENFRFKDKHNVCIDTHLHHYAVIKDSEIEIFKTPESWRSNDIPEWVSNPGRTY